jgi:short-subunit dehydrogenase
MGAGRRRRRGAAVRARERDHGGGREPRRDEQEREETAAAPLRGCHASQLGSGHGRRLASPTKESAMSLADPDPNATVLVTGASAGIGEQLARQLAARGHNVTLVARRKPKLEALADELRRAHGIQADVRKANLSEAGARTRLVNDLTTGAKAVTAVCNNAGFGSFGRIHELDADREAEMVRLNVNAVHDLTMAFLPGMVARGSGAILNLASVAAFQPMPQNATYSATKAFVLSFSESVHGELAGTGVSCTALCPGPVPTEFSDVAGVGDEQSDVPGFVWVSAEDVARAGIEGMAAGKRVVIPGALTRAMAAGGRFAPRSVLLPVANKLLGARLGGGR